MKKKKDLQKASILLIFFWAGRVKKSNSFNDFLNHPGISSVRVGYNSSFKNKSGRITK